MILDLPTFLIKFNAFFWRYQKAAMASNPSMQDTTVTATMKIFILSNFTKKSFLRGEKEEKERTELGKWGYLKWNNLKIRYYLWSCNWSSFVVLIAANSQIWVIINTNYVYNHTFINPFCSSRSMCIIIKTSFAWRWKVI